MVVTVTADGFESETFLEGGLLLDEVVDARVKRRFNKRSGGFVALIERTVAMLRSLKTKWQTLKSGKNERTMQAILLSHSRMRKAGNNNTRMVAESASEKRKRKMKDCRARKITTNVNNN